VSLSYTSLYCSKALVSNCTRCDVRANVIPNVSPFCTNVCRLFKHSVAVPWGTLWRSWLRHCATSLKVAGSISDGVIGIFHWHNPSGRTMVLGSTHPPTEMSTTNISWWVKADDCLEIWKSRPPGTLRACPGLCKNCFTFYCSYLSTAISTAFVEVFSAFDEIWTKFLGELHSEPTYEVYWFLFKSAF
jgi:hypothetical protein